MRQLGRLLVSVLETLTTLVFGGLLIVVLLQIAFRSVLSISIPWTEEMSRFLFIYATFLGSALALKKREHINMGLIFDRLPTIPRLTVSALIQLGMGSFIIVATIGAYKMMKINWAIPSATMMWFPMGWVYLGQLVGFILMAAFLLLWFSESMISLARTLAQIRNRS